MPSDFARGGGCSAVLSSWGVALRLLLHCSDGDGCFAPAEAAWELLPQLLQRRSVSGWQFMRLSSLGARSHGLDSEMPRPHRLRRDSLPCSDVPSSRHRAAQGDATAPSVHRPRGEAGVGVRSGWHSCDRVARADVPLRPDQVPEQPEEQPDKGRCAHGSEESPAAECCPEAIGEASCR